MVSILMSFLGMPPPAAVRLRLLIAGPSAIEDGTVVEAVRAVTREVKHALAPVGVTIDSHGVAVVCRHHDQGLL